LIIFAERFSPLSSAMPEEIIFSADSRSADAFRQMILADFRLPRLRFR